MEVLILKPLIRNKLNLNPPIKIGQASVESINLETQHIHFVIYLVSHPEDTQEVTDIVNKYGKITCDYLVDEGFIPKLEKNKRWAVSAEIYAPPDDLSLI